MNQDNNELKIGEEFKKTLLRFLKENGVYKFIIGEIQREYPLGLDNFIEYLFTFNLVKGVFNKRSVLSFHWDDDVLFWREIHEKWLKECSKIKWY